jgi:hypothetical protein
VGQVRLTSVLVSWDGLVTRLECADQFLGRSTRIIFRCMERKAILQ